MRVSFSNKDRIQFFTELQQKNIGLRQIAEITGVSVRTISDWKRGKYTIPSQHFETIVSAAQIDQGSINPLVMKDWWHNGEAGKKGAAIRMQKYGSLGTSEGRRLGGINSYLSRKGKMDGIFTPKIIRKPVKNKLFAEFIGILIGDGGLTQYQVVVTTNSVDDYEYSLFVAKLIERLFDVKPSLSKRKNQNCITIVVSSVELVKFLKLNGVLQGDKIRQNLDIPRWILENRKYAIACLRGIFDTDGCIFQECHAIKQKRYCYPRWALVSASPYLRASIHEILIDLEFCPKIRNNRSVNLESFSDIQEYFRVIGTSNPKHLSRFRSFGGVG